MRCNWPSCVNSCFKYHQQEMHSTRTTTKLPIYKHALFQHSFHMELATILPIMITSRSTRSDDMKDHIVAKHFFFLLCCQRNWQVPISSPCGWNMNNGCIRSCNKTPWNEQHWMCLSKGMNPNITCMDMDQLNEIIESTCQDPNVMAANWNWTMNMYNAANIPGSNSYLANQKRNLEGHSTWPVTTTIGY
jgi:hypothetical protein